MKRRLLLAAAGAVVMSGLPLEASAKDEGRQATERADVIVVGGGAAGLSAAVSAAEAAQAENKKLKIVLF